MMVQSPASAHPRASDRGLDAPEARSFGGYEVVEKIAGGGMAEVFLARAKTPPHTFFALKKIRADRSDDPDFRRMLLDEAKIACRLKHPNIARVVGLEEHDGQLGLLLDYVDGIDLIALQALLKDRAETIPLDVAIYTMLQVLEGLDFAHNVIDDTGERLMVVHRDVSPGNIMIDLEGRIRIVDWGIARAKNRFSHTEAGNVKGKFRYMAPEQISGGQVGPYTDVYAAAVTFWELLSGRRVYDHEEVPQLMMKVAGGHVPHLDEARPGLPVELHDVYKRATARRPTRRYQTAGEFADGLDSVPVEIDPDACREKLKSYRVAARLRDWKRGYERAVEKAKAASEHSDLEDALLRALEEPDRVERVDTRDSFPAEG